MGMNDFEGGGKKNASEETIEQKARRQASAAPATLFLAALAFNAPDRGHAGQPGTTYDTYEPFTTTESQTMANIPEKAKNVVNELDALFTGTDAMVPADMIKKVEEAINKYVEEVLTAEFAKRANQPGGSPENDVSPLNDIWMAVQGRSDMNPIVQGLIMKNVNKSYENLRGKFEFDEHGDTPSAELKNPLDQKQ